jgi:hypothetical protein
MLKGCTAVQCVHWWQTLTVACCVQSPVHRVNTVATTLAISQKLLPNTSKGTFNDIKDLETPSFFLIGQKLSGIKIFL